MYIYIYIYIYKRATTYTCCSIESATIKKKNSPAVVLVSPLAEYMFLWSEVHPPTSRSKKCCQHHPKPLNHQP